jgi:hypothetical protein
VSIGGWLQTQRKLHKAGRLHPDRLKLLQEAGVSLGPLDEAWEARFEELAAFVAKHGHARVPVEEGALGQWVAVQRRMIRAGRLAEPRRKRLLKLGFIESVHDLRWEERFAELLDYKKANGTTHVSYATHQRLALWCQVQRDRAEKRTLTPEQKRRLKEIGFEFRRGALRASALKAWERKVQQIAKLRARDRGASLPHPLARWASTQLARAKHRDSETSKERARRVRQALSGATQ